MDSSLKNFNIFQKIKFLAGKTFLKNIYISIIQAKQYWRWKTKALNTPPHRIKQKIIKEYQSKYKPQIFIETGTYLGEMVSAMRNIFKKVYSVELSVELYQNAQEKFSEYKHISILHGDSTNILPKILKDIKEPGLFWLDGHYSEGITAKGQKDTPILQELHCIFNHAVKNHIILIDDARCFIGQNDYPTLEQLRNFVLTHRIDTIFEVQNDIIRIICK